LQPQNRRQKGHRLLVEMKSDNAGSGVGGGIMIGDDVLQVTPCAALIALIMVRVADNLITDEPVGRR